MRILIGTPSSANWSLCYRQMAKVNAKSMPVVQFEVSYGRRYKKKLWGGLFSESMAIMGPITRAIDGLIDKLPRWAQLTCAVVVALGSVYCIARDGFFSFLLKMIFSPLP